MMTTTIDRDWSSLPFKTSFLPLIQQMTLYLGRRLVTPRPRNLLVNQQHTLPAIRDAQDVQVLTPDGRSIELQSGRSSETTWSFRQTEQPGIYTVTQGSNKTIKERFSVNVDIRESQTETTAISDIERRLNPTSSSTAMAQKDAQGADNTLPGSLILPTLSISHQLSGFLRVSSASRYSSCFLFLSNALARR